MDAAEIHRRIVASTLGLEFDPEMHVYRWDGRVLPSVTGICRVASGEQSGVYAPGSAERGKRVERAVQTFYEVGISAAEELLEEEDEPYWSSFLDWLETDEAAEVIPRFWQVPIAVVSEGLPNYCGTLDIIADLVRPPHAAILDLKTMAGRGTTPKGYRLQLAGYTAAVRLLTGALPGRGIFRLTPGVPGRIEWDNDEAAILAFGCAATARNWFQRRTTT